MRVLILGPWPIARPRHGGQIRASSIVAHYESRGHEVEFIGIYDKISVPVADTTAGDVAIDSDAMDYISRSGLSWEISLWDAFAEVPKLFQRFASAVERFRPDVVQFEEPYLWPVVRKLRARGLLQGVHVIHSSYNFETEYRRELAEITGREDQAVLRYVMQQEVEIARECDAIFAVSDQDAKCFRRLGARRVLVARNGGRRPTATEAAGRALRGYVGSSRYALFVSSAHPPNAQGLLDFAEAAPAQLTGPLFIAGSVHHLLETHRHRFPILQGARMLGVLDPVVLDALLASASVILLPKTRGGGSNLKTAEALLTDGAVVATSSAFTGFEPWRDEPGIAIADEPARFWQHVEEALNAPSTSFDRRSEGVLWSACLSPMTDTVAELAGKHVAARDLGLASA